MTEHAFWITSRAAGIVALLAASLAVALGLLMSTPLRTGLPECASCTRRCRWRRWSRSPSTRSRCSATATSSRASPTSRSRSSAASGWALGIVAGWLFVILGLSYYVRGRIGPQRWRMLHRFTALAWVLGVAHALMMGTDAGTVWFLLAAALS